MKNLIYLLLAVLILSSCNDPIVDPPLTFTDSISMGAGYANDIYYSLENGIVKTSARNNWDIAFSTNPMTSTILINEGLGIELYTYPNGDKDAWDAVDTSLLATWTAQYNSDTIWMNGAFDRHATGHPDYGWGVYNTQTHDVMGDSLFIIKLSDGSIKKLFIEQRQAATNSFIIKYADISDAGETSEISCAGYTTKNFIYYSLSTGEIVDNEPESTAWDFVFTKYYDESIPYIVAGVLSNKDLEVVEVRNTAVDMADPETAEYTTDISVIGSDWKSFNMGTYTYDIEADLCFFVKKGETGVYKIVMTGTDGSASGKFVFDVVKVKD